MGCTADFLWLHFWKWSHHVQGGLEKQKLWICSTKNVRFTSNRADVAVDWHSHKSSPEHVREHFLSWTFKCFSYFLSVGANSYISKGNINFSSPLKLLPNQKSQQQALVSWKCYKNWAGKSGCCWETLYSPFHSSISLCLSGDTCNMLLQLLWKTVVFITT